MGYGWPRRLRPPPPPLLSRLARHPDLLRHRLSGFAGQRSGEGQSLFILSLCLGISSAPRSHGQLLTARIVDL